MSDVIYLDNNATTRPCAEAIAAMQLYLSEWFGNPSSVHRFGQRARQGIDQARGEVARLLGCQESELLFTAGGTESISTAIRGLLTARSPRRKILTTTVEHSATRELLAALKRDNLADIIEIPVNADGALDMKRLAAELSDDVALVTLLWANNETGVLFPVKEVIALAAQVRRGASGNGCGNGAGSGGGANVSTMPGATAAAAPVPVHLDITQVVGKLPINLAELGVTAASFAGHKFHGPKGVGGLYARKGVRIRPLIVGGPQERGRRGGTENVPGLAGMGAAAHVAASGLAQMSEVAALRDDLERRILAEVPHSSVMGGASPRLPNTTNVAFHQLEAEAILLLLSEQGICASAGAACSSGSLEPSHVLLAMGIDPAIAHGAIRFSLSRYSTPAEVDALMDVLPPIITRLRRVLPVGSLK